MKCHLWFMDKFLARTKWCRTKIALEMFVLCICTFFRKIPVVVKFRVEERFWSIEILWGVKGMARETVVMLEAHYKNLEFRSQNLCLSAFRVDCIVFTIHIEGFTGSCEQTNSECIKRQWNDSLTREKSLPSRDWLRISMRPMAMWT